MTFGDYEYGPSDTDDESETSTRSETETHDRRWDPLLETCEHTLCNNDTPRDGQRLCDECTAVMHPDLTDTCPGCGIEL